MLSVNPLQELAVEQGFNPGRQGSRTGGYEADELRSAPQQPLMQSTNSCSGPMITYSHGFCALILQCWHLKVACKLPLSHTAYHALHGLVLQGAINLIAAPSPRFAACRGSWVNPSAWYEPGAGSAATSNWSAPADAASPWGRFSSAAGGSGGTGASEGGGAAAAGQEAGDAEEADNGSAVRFLDEEADGAVFLKRDATWHDEADAAAGDAAGVSSFQAQLPDWGAPAAGGGGGGNGTLGAGFSAPADGAEAGPSAAAAAATAAAGGDAGSSHSAGLADPATGGGGTGADAADAADAAEPSVEDLEDALRQIAAGAEAQAFLWEDDVDYDREMQASAAAADNLWCNLRTWANMRT